MPKQALLTRLFLHASRKIWAKCKKHNLKLQIKLDGYKVQSHNAVGLIVKK